MRRSEHGGDIYSRKIIYDFSANINPLGMPAAVTDVLRDGIALFEHYPDPDCMALREAIATSQNRQLLREGKAAFANVDGQAENSIKSSNVVCGNGAADLIYRLVHVLQPARAVVLAPGFSEYARALTECGCEVLYYLLHEEQMFGVDKELLSYLDESVDLLFLCNPNNPVGNTLESNLLEMILQRCKEKHIHVIADECFLDFVEEEQQCSVRTYLWQYPNVFLLKAFTKIYAMAGLRLGYGICSDEGLIGRLAEYGPCWNVSVPALLAGQAALRDDTFLTKTQNYVKVQREYLKTQLQAYGIAVYPSVANFLLLKPSDSRQLQEYLLKQGIAIRDCNNYVGLEEGFCRIAVRTEKENRYLIEKIGEFYGKVDNDTRHNV